MKKLLPVLLIFFVLTLCGCGKLRAFIFNETTVAESTDAGSAVATAEVVAPEVADRISTGEVYIAHAEKFGLTGIHCIYFEALSEDEKQLYNLLSIGIEKQSSEISLPGSLAVNEDTLLRVSNALLFDQPQIFWYVGKYQYTYFSDVVRSIHPQYKTFAEGFDASLSLMLEHLNNIHAQMNEQGLDLLKRERFIHDYICDNSEYNESLNDQSSYGALVEGKAVCAGLTRAFQLLCLREGMNCYYVSGEAVNSDEANALHAWSVLQLGADYYNVDVTWADQDRIGAIFYGYYNVTDEEINSNHTRNEESKLVPACTGTEYSFENIFGVNKKLAGVISASGCDTVINSIEEYKNLLREALIAGGEGESSFDFIVSAELHEKISACINDSENLRDEIEAAADALGLNGFSFNSNVSSTDYGEGYHYLVEHTSLWGK